MIPYPIMLHILLMFGPFLFEIHAIVHRRRSTLMGNLEASLSGFTTTFPTRC